MLTVGAGNQLGILGSPHLILIPEQELGKVCPECGRASHTEKLVCKFEYLESIYGEDQTTTEQEERSAFCYWDDDGMVNIHGRLPAEASATVIKAIEAVFDSIRATGENAPADSKEEGL